MLIMRCYMIKRRLRVMSQLQERNKNIGVQLSDNNSFSYNNGFPDSTQQNQNSYAAHNQFGFPAQNQFGFQTQSQLEYMQYNQGYGNQMFYDPASANPMYSNNATIGQPFGFQDDSTKISYQL